MELAQAFVAIVLVSMLVLISAVYLGGGMDALRRQIGILVVVAVGGVLSVLVIYLMATQGVVLLLVPIIASGSALAAALQARSLPPNGATSRQKNVARAMWILAGFFILLALLSIWLLLVGA